MNKARPKASRHLQRKHRKLMEAGISPRVWALMERGGGLDMASTIALKELYQEWVEVLDALIAYKRSQLGPLGPQLN